LPDLLTNSGGVTVSYFEYVKNLGHIRPGMLTKRWESVTRKRLMGYVQELGDMSEMADVET